jgi:hypothetical protein
MQPFLGMVQTSLDLVVKKIIDTLKTLGVIAILDLHGIINDNIISTEASDAALDRERADSAATRRNKVHEFGPIFFDLGVKSLLVPFAPQDVANGVGDFIG